MEAESLFYEQEVETHPAVTWKQKENVLCVQSLLNVLNVYFPQYLPVKYIDFQNVNMEIFASKIKIVSFLKAITAKIFVVKEKKDPHLPLSIPSWNQRGLAYF